MRHRLSQLLLFIFIMSVVTLSFATDPQANLNLNSSQLGFNGPFSSQLQYSDQYGFSLNNKYTQALGLADAIALELDFGGSEYRFGATWAHTFGLQQRIKITVERLAQKLAFDFASGTTHNWIAQNAIGGEYQYLFNHSWLNSIDIGGYYAKANSKTLPTVTFWQDGILYDNIRHIAGATSENINIGVDTQPWSTGLINLNLDYDNVHFNPLYETADNKSGIGGSISLEQLLTNHLKLQLLSSFRQPYNQYEASLFWLAPSAPGTRLELGFDVSRLINHTNLPNENRYSLQLAFSWGGPTTTPAGYTIAPDSREPLISWVKTPTVHMPTVLAMRDQKVQRHVTSGNKTKAPSNDDYPSSQPIPNQHLYSDGKGELTLDVKTLGHFTPDGLTFHLDVPGTPALQGAHFDPNREGVLVIPANNKGTFYGLAISAYNSVGNTAQIFAVTIDRADDPWADTINSTWVQTNQSYQFDAHSYFHYSHDTKPDAHNYLKYSLESAPTGFTIDPTSGVISGTIPSDASASPYTITIKAIKYIDDHDTNISTTTSYKLYLKPSATTTAGNYAHAKNSAFTIDAKTDGQFNSNGSPALTYSLQNAPSWLTIDSSSGVITVPADKSDYGNYSFNVIGTKTPDSTLKPESVSWPINLKITPLPTTIPNQWADPEHVNLDVASYFQDPNRKLTYGAEHFHDLYAEGGYVIGTLDNAETTPGHTGTITGAIDAEHKQVTNITIYSLPKALGAKNVEAQVNETIATIPAATEGFTNHGNTSWWSYKLDGNVPPGISIDPTSGDITGTPTTNGIYNFTVVATKAPPNIDPKTASWPITMTIKHRVLATIECPDKSLDTLPYVQKDDQGLGHTFTAVDQYSYPPNGRELKSVKGTGTTNFECDYKQLRQESYRYNIHTQLPSPIISIQGNSASFYELTD